MFSASSELFIFVSTDCCLVNMTSYCLNPNLVLNLCTAIVLQPTITLDVNSLYIKTLLSLVNVHIHHLLTDCMVLSCHVPISE